MPGFPVGTTSSTFLAGPIGQASAQQARHIAIRITGREVVIAVLFVVAVIVLLTIPVVWGVVAEATSSAAEKAAPATFFVGLGVLCTGLVVGFELLAIVGGSLVGLVVIGFIIDNYLAAAGRAARARTAQRTVTDLFCCGHHVGHPRVPPGVDPTPPRANRTAWCSRPTPANSSPAAAPPRSSPARARFDP